MSNLQKIILIIVLILIPISYIILQKQKKTKVIVIPPLVIEAKSKETSQKQEALAQQIESDSPLKILKNLQKAVAIQPVSEEVEAQEILTNLKNRLNKEIVQKKKVIKSKKEIIKKRIVHKKKIVKKSKARKKIHKIKTTTKKPRISREEEVQHYRKAHKNGLEVVSESKVFEINDPTESIPDSAFFDKPNPKINKPVEVNNFVKTLGVIKKSKVYEVNNVEIEKKREEAKDGVVDISTATVETEELKKLKFVKPLEVTEVTQPFEASKAKEYLP